MSDNLELRFDIRSRIPDQPELPLPPMGYRLATHAEAVKQWHTALMWRLPVKHGSFRPTQCWVRFGWNYGPALYAVRE
jgi:hypothetical protein